MTPKTLHYFTRSVYGTPQTYLDATHPETAIAATHIARLTGRKTLTPTDFLALQDLGFALTQVIDPTIRR